MAVIMLLLSHQLTPRRQAGTLRRGFRTAAAFTLVEIVIALAVLGTMAAGVYLGFNAINTYAVSSRLYSEAQTAAQNQIDLILSREPFDIFAAKISGSFDPCLNKIPVELMTTSELDALASSGTCGVTFPTTPPPATSSSSYPYYPYYRTAGGPLQKEAFIYRDSVTGNILVKGTLTSTVTDTGATMSPFADPSASATPSPLNTRRAKVEVSYNFRGRDYQTQTTSGAQGVVMYTLRAADQ